jgi:hypothetical protein
VASRYADYAIPALNRPVPVYKFRVSESSDLLHVIITHEDDGFLPFFLYGTIPGLSFTGFHNLIYRYSIRFPGRGMGLSQGV